MVRTEILMEYRAPNLCTILAVTLFLDSFHGPITMVVKIINRKCDLLLIAPLSTPPVPCEPLDLYTVLSCIDESPAYLRGYLIRKDRSPFPQHRNKFLPSSRAVDPFLPTMFMVFTNDGSINAMVQVALSDRLFALGTNVGFQRPEVSDRFLWSHGPYIYTNSIYSVVVESKVYK